MKMRAIICYVALLTLAPTGAFAQAMFYDPFDYADGALAGQGDWTGPSSGSRVNVVSDASLTYPGIVGTGGRILVDEVGASATHTHGNFFPPITGVGNSAYASFLFKPTEIGTTYFIANLTAGSVQGNLGRLSWTAGENNLSISFRGGSVQGPAITLGQTYFIVLKTTMVDGVDNDTFELFIDPVLGDAEPAATASTTASGGNDINPALGITGFVFRFHFSDLGTGIYEIDEFRAGTTWAEVTDVATAPVPTLSEWGMIAMALMLLTAGSLTLRRRLGLSGV